MIDSTYSPDRIPRPDPVASEPARPASGRSSYGRDSLSTEKADQLRAALQSQPEVRPDVVARGRLLAADPNYPPAAVIGAVAKLIAGSPDLSEDPS